MYDTHHFYDSFMTDCYRSTNVYSISGMVCTSINEI